MRVVFVLRSAEIFPVLYRFVLSGLRTCSNGQPLLGLPFFLCPFFWEAETHALGLVELGRWMSAAADHETLQRW